MDNSSPLSLAVAVPAIEGRRKPPVQWESILLTKTHKGEAALEYIFDTRSKASARATAIKARFAEADPNAKIRTAVRQVPGELAHQLKLGSSTLWGVWVAYLGDRTQAERLDDAARRRAATSSPQNAPQGSQGASGTDTTAEALQAAAMDD